MKSYKVNEADAVFSESINITETTDTNHADNINAAPKEIFENTVALNREVKTIKKNMEEESGESISYNNESSGLNAENLQEAVDELAGKQMPWRMVMITLAIITVFFEANILEPQSLQSSTHRLLQEHSRICTSEITGP